MNKIATIVHTKFKDKTIPQILFLNQESAVLCKLTYLFNQSLFSKELSYRTLTDSTQALTLLYDYYYLVFKPSNPNAYKESNLLHDLFRARLNGSVLNWKDLSFKQATRQIKAIERFCNWLKYHSHYEETPFTLLLKKSYDFYLKKEPIKFQKQGLHEASRFLPSFPEHKVMELLTSTENLSIRVAYLLMLNGRRLSETLHLYASDIQVYNGEIKVYIAHPETSYYKWKGKEGNRAEYLKDTFNLIPRNKLTNSARKVGWKNLRFADPIRQVSQVHFIMDLDKLLLKWHQEYVLKTRKHIKHHPYYLVDVNGEPLSERRVRQHFNEACKRIGLDSSRNLGTTMGGLRTFYGRYCFNLNINPLLITQMLSSSRQYTTLNYQSEAINFKLLKGVEA